MYSKNHLPDGIKKSWSEKDGYFLSVQLNVFAFENDIFESGISGGRPLPLPPKHKSMAGLIKHWTVQLHTGFVGDGIPVKESFPRSCKKLDITIDFIRENAKGKRYSLGVQFFYDGNGDPRKNPEAKNIGVEKLLTLRDVSTFWIEDVEDSREVDGVDDEIRHTKEFNTYIEDTVKLPEGAEAVPFKGERYEFIDPVDSDLDSDWFFPEAFDEEYYEVYGW